MSWIDDKARVELARVREAELPSADRVRRRAPAAVELDQGLVHALG